MVGESEKEMVLCKLKARHALSGFDDGKEPEVSESRKALEAEKERNKSQESPEERQCSQHLDFSQVEAHLTF